MSKKTCTYPGCGGLGVLVVRRNGGCVQERCPKCNPESPREKTERLSLRDFSVALADSAAVYARPLSEVLDEVVCPLLEAVDEMYALGDEAD